MILGPMADALAPLRSRMPQPIHEREILRVVATVRGDDPAASMDRARREVLAWAQKRSGDKPPQEAWNGQSFDYLAGGRMTLGVRLDSEDAAAWALRGDDPDKLVAGRIWTTEVTLRRRLGGGLPQISLRLLVSTPETELLISPHVPRLIQQVEATCGLSVGSFTLTVQARRIASEDDVDELLALLESPDRRLPVIVASGDERSNDRTTPLIDADALARATLGLAHVIALPASRSAPTRAPSSEGIEAVTQGRLLVLEGPDGVGKSQRYVALLSASALSLSGTLCWPFPAASQAPYASWSTMTRSAFALKGWRKRRNRPFTSRRILTQLRDGLAFC